MVVDALDWAFLTGATGSNGHLYAREDSDAEDLSYPDLPSPLVAEDPRVGGDGLVSGA